MSGLCEYCHARCCRLLETRGKVHAQLELAQLRELFDATLAFVEQTEDLFPRKAFFGRLRGVLVTQAKGACFSFLSPAKPSLQTSWRISTRGTSTRSLRPSRGRNGSAWYGLGSD